MSDEPINQEPAATPVSREPAAPAPFAAPTGATDAPPKNNRTLWIVIAVAAVLCILCCCLALAAWGIIRNNINNGRLNLNLDNPGRITGSTTSQDFDQSVQVNGMPTIAVNLPFGDVRIETGAAGEVAVRGQMVVADNANASSALESLQPKISVVGYRVTISNDWQENLNRLSTRHDLEVTLSLIHISEPTRPY